MTNWQNLPYTTSWGGKPLAKDAAVVPLSAVTSKNLQHHPPKNTIFYCQNERIYAMDKQIYGKFIISRPFGYLLPISKQTPQKMFKIIQLFSGSG